MFTSARFTPGLCLKHHPKLLCLIQGISLNSGPNLFVSPQGLIRVACGQAEEVT